MPNAFARRRFGLPDQLAFARLSADTNPIHLDPIAARRTVAGQCIVHGAHSVLWVLDLMARTSVAVTSLHARFLKPVFLDEEVTCVWDAPAGRVRLSADGVTLVDIGLVAHTSPAAVATFAASPSVPGRGTPAGRSFADCAAHRPQKFEFHGDAEIAAEMFPNAVRLYGLQTVCEMAALSYIVGMEVPGLHSLLAGLRLDLRETRDDRVFSVADTDARFKRLLLTVNGRHLHADIEAFLRPVPAQMPTMSEVSPRVRPHEHAAVSALVIGGSRGLGEIAAKLIAAGGGRVILTYSTGTDDAARVVEDIRTAGGQCQALQLTVGEGPPLPAELPSINQLYYFATPKIFGKRATRFDDDLYRKFLAVYVSGFETICTSLIARNNRCSVFYPSSIAIESRLPELAEYAKAKAQGEALCQHLNSCGQLDILVPRLPRTATDQTQAILHAAAEDPVNVMAPLVRRMTDLGR